MLGWRCQCCCCWAREANNINSKSIFCAQLQLKWCNCCLIWSLKALFSLEILAHSHLQSNQLQQLSGYDNMIRAHHWRITYTQAPPPALSSQSCSATPATLAATWGTSEPGADRVLMSWWWIQAWGGAGVRRSMAAGEWWENGPTQSYEHCLLHPVQSSTVTSDQVQLFCPYSALPSHLPLTHTITQHLQHLW